MTAYSLDENGSNGNSGLTSALAFKDIRFAMRYMSAGDTLNIASGLYRAPAEDSALKANNKLLFDLVATYIGDADNKPITIQSRDLSGTAASPEKWQNPDMDMFFSDGSIYYATTAGDIPTKETTITNGSASTKFERGGSASSYIDSARMFLTQDVPVKVIINYVDGSATSQLQVQLRDLTNATYWNNTTQAWQAGGSYTQIPNNHPGTTPTGANFQDFEINATAPGAGTNVHYQLFIQTTVVDAPSYVDSISVTDGTSELNGWTQIQSGANGNVYELDSMEVDMIWWSTQSDWNISSVNALVDLGDPDEVKKHGGLATLADALTTQDAWAWGTRKLRVNLGTKTINDVHLEAWYTNTRAPVDSTAVADIRNIHFACTKQSIIYSSAVIATNTKYSHGWAPLTFVGAVSPQFNKIEIGPAMKDGCVVASPATPVFREIYVHDCLDDGIQSESSTLTIYGGYGTRCGSAHFSGNAAFGSHTAGALLHLRNVTAWGNYEYGITGFGDTANSSLINVLSYGNNVADNGTFDINVRVGDPNFGTAENVHFGTETNTGISDGVDDCVALTSDPFSTAPALAEGSVPVGAGQQWWATAPRPTGYGGEPFSDVDTDVGGVQSTWSALHPKNI